MSITALRRAARDCAPGSNRRRRDPSRIASCPGGETGIHKGLKIPRRLTAPCRFKSGPGHSMTVVRPLVERDLPEAQRIIRLAFGTFLGARDPETFRTDRDYGYGRFGVEHTASFGADEEGSFAGSNFAMRQRAWPRFPHAVPGRGDASPQRTGPQPPRTFRSRRLALGFLRLKTLDAQSTASCNIYKYFVTTVTLDERRRSAVRVVPWHR